MPCQGVRGATTANANTPEEILAATCELLQALCSFNGLQPADLASAIFTATPDLTAAFPARAARDLGWTRVPLLDAVEMSVPNALPRCIRVLLHWNTDRSPAAIRHVYLREAAALRPDYVDDGRVAACEAPAMAANGAARLPVAGTGTNGPEPAEGPADQERRSEMQEPDPTTLPARPAVPAEAVRSSVMTVAYQGEPGAYSQEAIFQHFGRATETLACPSFEDIFAAVEEGRANFGLLPIENSQTGSILQSYDLLLERDLPVVAEVKLRVRHCLLVPPGTAAGDIRQARSHPQALAQVERYLKRHGWQATPAYDTAGAARELAGDPQPGVAAIASALAGQIYGLDVLENGIEDSPNNTTRFFVLGREDSQERSVTETGAGGVSTGYKTSLAFATTHTPGALHRALGEFAERGLNLAKIESRPRRNRPWHYVFYLDLEGHWQDPPVAQALVALLARAAFLKLFGSYPAAE